MRTKNSVTVFWVQIAVFFLAGLGAGTSLCLWGSRAYGSELAELQALEEPRVPGSIPMGFAGFDNDVVLGKELEALEELENEAVTAYGPVEAEPAPVAQKVTADRT